jgi:hypothetical protein
MSGSIGDAFDTTALARLHFHALDRSEQVAAIRRMSADGMSDYGISHATGLAVEMVRRVLHEAPP